MRRARGRIEADPLFGEGDVDVVVWLSGISTSFYAMKSQNSSAMMFVLCLNRFEVCIFSVAEPKLCLRLEFRIKPFVASIRLIAVRPRQPMCDRRIRRWRDGRGSNRSSEAGREFSLAAR